ncbi:serine/threonine-protein kinase [Actinomadura litoris]|uniref:non-specific serine/threonine protein kinase n=1 Tax=Actinomadura litoris TaxID=2678616 RepID=A0A7K1KWT5_9ACTN|nr:serine/threonine-protein kinase [Actinomadura litoris]MUN36664.1 protein kinase [Actinomadura litoris]
MAKKDGAVEPGVALGGRYRLVTRLARGGMGEVWSAVDQSLARWVAIKIVLAEMGADPMLIARLRREAQTAAALSHPGITVVYDIGEHEGHPFFVMELLEGTDFKALLADSPGGMPAVRAAGLMAQVADALDYAHRKGVVHRDIKPANLIELVGGGVRICDFGICRYSEATTGLTASGGVLGTPAYMAPEQYEDGSVDARSDLYSFGCTLYALLTGRPPFPGPSLVALMRQHLSMPPARLTAAPSRLADLVASLLSKNPGDRPASAGKVADALRAVAAERSVPSTFDDDLRVTFPNLQPVLKSFDEGIADQVPRARSLLRWPDFGYQLGRELAALDVDTILIIRERNETHHYVQAMRETDRLYAEAVSNNFLTGDLLLTEQDEAEMVRLGWNPPRDPVPKNWWTELPASATAADHRNLASIMMVGALRDVQGVRWTSSLVYESFWRHGTGLIELLDFDVECLDKKRVYVQKSSAQRDGQGPE